MNNKLILRTLTSSFDDVTKGYTLTHNDVDNNFLYLKGQLIYTASTLSNNLILNKINGDSLTIDLSSISGGGGGGNYLPLSGGTVTGPTIFTNGLTGNTIYGNKINIGDTIITSAQTRALNVIGTDAVMRVVRIDPTMVNDPSFEFIAKQTSDGPNIAYWDAYVDGSVDAFKIRHRTTGSNVDKFTVLSGGSVGIGTTTPTELLDVAKPISGISARFRGSVDVGDFTNSDAQIRIGQGRTNNGNAFLDLIGDTGNTYYGLRLIRWSADTSQLTHKGTGSLEIVTEDAAPLDLKTNATSRLYITSGGTVGIGTTAPTEKLEVNGKTKTTTLQITSGATIGYVLTSDGNGVASWQAATGGGGGGVSITPYNNVGNATTITWNVSGVSTNYEVTLTGTSTLNLTNVRNGEYGTIIVKQDGVGSRTLSLGTVNGTSISHKVVNGGGGTITLTSNASATDILSFTYNGTYMFWTVGNDYY